MRLLLAVLAALALQAVALEAHAETKRATWGQVKAKEWRGGKPRERVKQFTGSRHNAARLRADTPHEAHRGAVRGAILRGNRNRPHHIQERR